MKNLVIVIVGAGIGGLQAALALAADGHQVTVLESVKEFLEVCYVHTIGQQSQLLTIPRSGLVFVFLPIHPSSVYLGGSIWTRFQRFHHSEIDS